MNARLLVRGVEGRDRLARAALRLLGRGEALARVDDVYAGGEAHVTVPDDATAAILAREDPLVRADGSTLLRSYVRVRADRAAGLRWTMRADGTYDAVHVALDVLAEGA